MGTRKPDRYERAGCTLGRANGWWVADFDHVGKDGKARRKRKQLVPLDRPEDDARAALDRFADNLRAVREVQATPTIGVLWRQWLDERARDGLSNEIYNANWTALAPHFEHRAPAMLTRDDWRSYASKRFAAGYAPATVHTELSRLSICLKFAAEMGWIAKRPKHWLPAKPKPRNRVLTPNEARALIEGARGGDPHIEVFVVLLFATGGRHTAILDLEWSRVDFGAGTIDLEVDLPPDPMNKSWRKGRAAVVMSRMAREVLTRAKAGATCAHVVEHGGRRLKECREGFKAACKRAGLGWGETQSDGSTKFVTDITPHTIRHTVASWAKGKVATEFTAALLGHADEATTRLVYQHGTAEHTRPVVEHIDNVLAPLPSFDAHDVGASPKEAPKRDRSSVIDIEPEGGN